ncbi:MAG TPA: class I SAM-dependent methyltransferase [Actinomycetota bacterium]|nr:class I SAM-dependent methyltransferase [Actinomycetota bacterium]
MAPVGDSDAPYYRRDLALIHHRGFGFHADACAPGILGLLEPVRERGGLVVELGCGSGLLTRHLLDAGHRVLATDASPAMLEIASSIVGDAEGVRRLVLPDDPIPRADAIVSVGHVLNYLPSADAIDRALVGAAEALEAGGVLALDLCDLAYGEARREAGSMGWVDEDWAIVTQVSLPTPDRFVRQMATFVRNDDGSWRRDDERHDNILIDTGAIPALLARHGVEASVRPSFGSEDLPVGLRAIIGRRSSDRSPGRR